MSAALVMTKAEYVTELVKIESALIVAENDNDFAAIYRLEDVLTWLHDTHYLPEFE